MRYELHYASLRLDPEADIPCTKHANKETLIHQLKGHALDHNPKEKHLYWDETPFLGRLNADPKIVYLCAIDTPPSENGVLLIDSNPENILIFVDSHTMTPTKKKIYLQEYESYEEAYGVALMMKEVSELCYNK